MSFISLLPSFRFNSSFLFVLLFFSFQLVHFIASVLSLQPFPSIRYFLSFVSKNISPVRLPLPFVSSRSFHFKPFISFHHSFRFNLYIWCHCRLEKNRSCEWLLFWISTTARFATMLQFLIQALFAFLLETQENMDLMAWGLRNIPFIGTRGRHTSPSPQAHSPADSYLLGISQLATKRIITLGVCAKLLLTTRSFWKVIEEGTEQTDAYGCHAINSQYIVRTASKTCRTSCLRTTHRACHEFAETLPAQASGARMETPSYVFECYTVWSGLRERIHLREQFVFGKEFVFGGQV